MVKRKKKKRPASAPATSRQAEIRHARIQRLNSLLGAVGPDAAEANWARFVERSAAQLWPNQSGSGIAGYEAQAIMDSTSVRCSGPCMIPIVRRSQDYSSPPPRVRRRCAVQGVQLASLPLRQWLVGVLLL